MLAFFAIFINWYMLAFVLALVAIAALIYFTQGPIVLLKVVVDARTWIGIAVAAGLITLYSSSQTIQKQQQVIQTTTTNNKANKDALAVVTDDTQQKTVRVKQAVVQQQAINNAKPGDEVDGILDELANEDGEADAAQ